MVLGFQIRYQISTVALLEALGPDQKASESPFPFLRPHSLELKHIFITLRHQVTGRRAIGALDGAAFNNGIIRDDGRDKETDESGGEV